MAETRRIERLIFDMDGTLSDTAKATVDAANQAAAQLGLPPMMPERVKRAIGVADPEFYRLLQPEADDAALARFGELTGELEEERVRQLGPAMLFDGVADMLAALAGMGVPLHIASTGGQVHVDNTLGVSGIRPLFTSVHCGQPHKVDMVRDIIAPGGAAGWLMVGDMRKDSEAARANGVAVAGAAFGYCVPEDYALFDLILETPADLVRLVREGR